MSHEIEPVTEQVLKALGTAEAPHGLDRRVLARLTEARAQRRSAPWISAISAVSAPLLAGAGLALAATIWFAMPRLHPSAPHPSHETAQARLPQPAASQLVGTAPHAATIRPNPTLSPSTPHPGPPKPRPSLNPDDALALAEMRAPSQPEPPLPITQQERLLQRAAQTNAALALATALPIPSDSDPTDPNKPAEASPIPASPIPEQQSQPQPDIGTVLQASLFAGMNPATDE